MSSLYYIGTATVTSVYDMNIYWLLSPAMAKPLGGGGT